MSKTSKEKFPLEARLNYYTIYVSYSDGTKSQVTYASLTEACNEYLRLSQQINHVERQSLKWNNWYTASIVFALCETIYFGCNFYPGSPAECICDLIAIAMLLHGIKKGTR